MDLHWEPSKTVLVVGSSYQHRVCKLFADLGVRVAAGSCVLEGFVRKHFLAADFVSGKVQSWRHCIWQLSTIAKVEPQASFSAVVKSL